MKLTYSVHCYARHVIRNVGENLFRTSNLIGSCWPEALFFSELGFIFSFVWVRAIYCFLNQSCEPFLELPAHPRSDGVRNLITSSSEKLGRRFFFNVFAAVLAIKKCFW